MSFDMIRYVTYDMPISFFIAKHLFGKYGWYKF